MATTPGPDGPIPRGYEMRGATISFGRIFGRAFGAMRAEAATIFGLAFVFAALPGIVIGQLTRGMTSTAVVNGDGQFAVTRATNYAGGAGLVAIVLGLVVYALSMAAIVRATVAHADGRRIGFGEAAAGGLRVALPVIGLSVLLGLAVGIASLFLLVPGIILAIMWCVAVPARAVEPIGVFAAFGRSRHLTKGARWTLFGFGLILFVIYIAVVIVAGILLVALGGGVGGLMAMAQAQAQPGIGAMLVNVLMNTVLGAIGGALTASLYVELRDWKDGPQAQRLADIFA